MDPGRRRTGCVRAAPDEPAGAAAGRRATGVFRGAAARGPPAKCTTSTGQTSADDELSLLLAVGADTAGDAQVVAEGVLPAEVFPRVQVGQDFGDIRFATLLAELDIRNERTALPGVQDKVSATMLSLPSPGRARASSSSSTPPSTRTWSRTKPSFCARRGSAAYAASAAVVHDRDKQSGLLVERFDRVAQGRDLPPRALALEDACQVLGLPPADKYRAGTEGVLAGLAAICQAPLPAARTLLAQLVFAYLSGNGDAHAKNFSVLQDEAGEWRPSPAYDVPSSQPYGDTTMALPIGGRSWGDSVPGTSWLSALP